MLRVNSFPRTGNMFASNFLNLFFDHDFVDYGPDVMHDYDLLSDSSVDQIVIIRDPKQSIPSSRILRKKNDPYNENGIEFDAQRWIDWHQHVLKNSNHLFLLTFEQLVSNPVECLTSIADYLGIGYDDKKEIHKHHNQHSENDRKASSTNVYSTSLASIDYEKEVQNYLSLDSSKMWVINNLYLNLKDEVFLNQAKLTNSL